jgi:Uma2 family endonuclease
MATATLPAEQRLIVHCVDWARYQDFLRAFEGRHIRLTYDGSNLEIMTVSGEHERGKKLMARLLEALTEELDIPIASFGNITLNREAVDRGLEPDECWYIEHETLLRDKAEVDLDTDPPPDLVVEVEITTSVLNRLDIYARLGIPEIWRFDGHTLRVCVLGADGRYTESDQSPTFPQLPLDGLASFFAQRGRVDETRLVKSFRAWVRTNVASRPQENKQRRTGKPKKKRPGRDAAGPG